ncbi:FKBP-type peptidyl-prolyl cis-trans isomerase [Winogradskyella sp. UBA3174]|uniref:FKBP-type peptidyl-prolyl cis-trans isomerase n=1 Tax=Winogradskyella sp. UBA3174 TaxID=1947785 RepID=UPI0025F100D0|nr:hypothetical protein [Winogradskyella sp. UBA3174]|tara:strand:+ start:21239 stop:22303 length:1065 start_codon:yes stop_codon:yes gene_type:complete
MKTKQFRLSLLVFFAFAFCISCEPDDDTVTNVFTTRDRDEQQIVDNDSILEFFATHYYNASFFETGINHKIEDIIISESAIDENGNSNRLLSEALADGTITTRTTILFEIDYTYYFLNLNQGEGDSPTFTDQVRVRYEGFTVETEEIFDQIVTPVSLPLTGLGFSGGAIPGWQRVLPEFNAALDFSIGSDGSTNYNNYGFGIMFIPSGLAYFASPPPGSSIDAYANLVFKFELLQKEELDHDNDGIPSYIENLNNNDDVFDDDTDEDGAPNYIDLDDDADGVATINELVSTTYQVDTSIDPEPTLAANEYEVSRSEVDGILTINTVTAVDSDNNNILDYLDENISENYNDDEDS